MSNLSKSEKKRRLWLLLWYLITKPFKYKGLCAYYDTFVENRRNECGSKPKLGESLPELEAFRTTDLNRDLWWPKGIFVRVKYLLKTIIYLS